MPMPFVAKPLETRDAALAYPVVRLIEPAVALDDWVSFIRELNDRRTDRTRGAIVIVDSGNYIHGIFCYDVKPELSGGSVLNVDKLVAVDNTLCAGADGALIGAMETLATSLSCSRITVALPEEWVSGPQPLRGICPLFRRYGYRGSVVGLVKPMDRPRASTG